MQDKAGDKFQKTKQTKEKIDSKLLSEIKQLNNCLLVYKKKNKTYTSLTSVFLVTEQSSPPDKSLNVSNYNCHVTCCG